MDNEIKRYYHTNERAKEDKKLLDKLKSTLKKKFKIGDSYSTEEGYSLEINKQTRTSMNNEMLLDILKENGFTEAVKTIEVPDDQVVEELLFSGKLTTEMISPAVNEKEIAVLKVTYNEKSSDAPTPKPRKTSTGASKDTF